MVKFEVCEQYFCCILVYNGCLEEKHLCGDFELPNNRTSWFILWGMIEWETNRSYSDLGVCLKSKWKEIGTSRKITSTKINFEYDEIQFSSEN